MLDSALSSFVGRLGLDVVVLLILVGILHRRRSTLPEMALVLTSLNIGLFAAVTVIGTGDFPTGIGFGLFGLLSLVRLRSAAFTLKDVAYTFLALVLALVNGLPERNLGLVLGLNLVVLAAVWVTDDSRRQLPTRRVRVVLDRAVFDEASARAALAERFAALPLAVVIEDVDTVRDTTRVSALVESSPAWWATRDPAAEELDDGAIEPGGRSVTLADLALSDLALSDLAPVDLDTVLAVAPLARRVDRKYLVPLADASELVARLADTHHALQVAGRRCTTYRSTYLDTGDLRLCRDHLQGRRLRWKARSRLYVEDGLCRFEVKVRGAREETVKHAVDLEPSSYGRYGAVERAFIGGVLAAPHPAVPDLRPVLEIGYTRATLVDLRAGARLTVDHGVVGRPTAAGSPELDRGSVAVDHDRVIVETKSGSRPCLGDLVLAAMGHRPLAISKYATSAALLARGVPDNQVRRLVGRGVSVRASSSHLDQEAS